MKAGRELDKEVAEAMGIHTGLSPFVQKLIEMKPEREATIIEMHGYENRNAPDSSLGYDNVARYSTYVLSFFKYVIPEIEKHYTDWNYDAGRNCFQIGRQDGSSWVAVAASFGDNIMHAGCLAFLAMKKGE